MFNVTRVGLISIVLLTLVTIAGIALYIHGHLAPGL